MKKIYSAANLPDAYIVLGLLKHAGIDARVFNQNAQSGMGEIPFTHVYPEIWLLNETEWMRAKEIIKAHEHAPVNSGTIFCPVCKEANPGNFQICWNCGSDIDTVKI